MDAHIFIGTPCFGGMVAQSYMQSIIGCMAEASGFGFSMTLSMIGNDALVTRARNTLVHQFMMTKHATHLLFIDSDIGFTAQDIYQLLCADKPIVGGLYPLKDHYWGGVTDLLASSGEAFETASLRYVGDCEAIYDQPRDQALVRVGFAGTGFLLISRACIERMCEAYPTTRYDRVDAPYSTSGATNTVSAHALFDCMIDEATRTYLSEDFTFCARWRAIGGEIWVDRSLRLSHTGPSRFMGDPMARGRAAL